MHKPKLHKRDLITALLLASVLTFPARAFTFTDSLFSIDIPEGEKTYYYTQRGTNMTGTMLENAQKQDMVLLIGSYNEAGTLQYTFKVEARSGTAAETANSMRGELVGSYDLAEPVEEVIAGVAGWSLSGWSIQNSNYAVKLYVVEEESCVVVSTMYQPAAESQVVQLLNTIQWADYGVVNDPGGNVAEEPDDTDPPADEPIIDPAMDDPAIIDPDMERDPDAVPLPGVTFEPDEIEPEPTADIPAIQPLEPVESRESGWREKISELLTEYDKQLLPVGIGGGAVALVLVSVARRKKVKPQRKRGKGQKKRGKDKNYAPRHAK